MFKRFVNVVEILALLAALGFVIALFAGGSGSSSAGGAARGQEVFQASCAVCHGDRGQGGVGPELGDGAVVEAFPNAADEVQVVTQGRGRMPGFEGRLSEEEIGAVVQYTRTGLG